MKNAAERYELAFAIVIDRLGFYFYFFFPGKTRKRLLAMRSCTVDDSPLFCAQMIPVDFKSLFFEKLNIQIQ